jgi:hypothetical protein
MKRRLVGLLARLVGLLALSGCAGQSLPAEMPLTAECRFDAPADPERSVLAIVRGDELVAVRGDGSEKVLHRFAEASGVPRDRVNGAALVARHGWIAAQAVWTQDSLNDFRREEVLLDPRGRLVWSAARRGGVVGAMALSERGDLATLADGDKDGLRVRADGTTEVLPGLLPAGEPGPDGSLLVRPAGSQDLRDLGWARPGAEGVAPLARPLFKTATVPSWSGDRVVYLGDVDGEPALVVEGAGEVKVVKVPAPAEDRDFLQVRVNGKAALVGRFWDPARVWRVDVTAGTIAEVSPAANGLHPFQYQDGPLLDDDGALLSELRGDYAGALYRSTDEGGSWAAIGADYRQVLAIAAEARGGTYVIAGTNGRYGGETEWPAPPPGAAPTFDGAALQIVRPASGTRFVREGEHWPPAAISDDGRCVGWFDADSTGAQRSKLVAYDAERGRSFDLAAGEARAALLGPVWLGP